ncbi:MAG: hypothetical protein EOO53_21580, partial [Gammaproteobacteria bacterium]
RGGVETATELAQTAAALDIAHVSARTTRNMLHDEGLKAMHMIRKPLLTRTHKRKRLDFALTHRDWTVQQWKQVIFSDETPILARPSDTHKLRWVKPTHGLKPEASRSCRARRRRSQHGLEMQQADVRTNKFFVC